MITSKAQQSMATNHFTAAEVLTWDQLLWDTVHCFIEHRLGVYFHAGKASSEYFDKV